MFPTPACKLGYPWWQVTEILGFDEADKFSQWMNGQTQAVCDGRSYDHVAKEYKPTNCGPHGVIVYVHDLLRYRAGLPVID